jgi:zinc protease
MKSASVLLTVVFCLTAAFAAEPQITTALTKDYPHQHSELAPDPDVTWGKLDNGFRYCIMPNEQPKGKVSLRLQVQAGSLQETGEQRGYAHYLEHMAFNGTEHFPPGKIVGLLQALGIAFGQHSNAHTSFDDTVYKLDLPDGEEATITTGLQVIADFAAGMLLLPEEIENERGVILAEMRDRNTPGFRLIKELYRGMYQGLTIADRFPIGTEESVNAAGVDQIRAYYDQWYRPERMVLVVVGEIIPSELVEQIKGRFEDIAAIVPAVPEVALGTLVADDTRFIHHREPEERSTSVYFVNVRAEERGPDSEILRRRLLAMSLAEQILNRRLADIVERNPAGAIFQGNCSSDHWLNLAQAFIEVEVQSGKAHEAVALVEQELRRFTTHGPSTSELAVAKAEYLGVLDENVARRKTRTNAQLAEKLYSMVQDDLVFRSPQQDRDLEGPWLADMEGREVQSALVQAWNGGHFLLAVLGKDDYGENAADQFKADWLASKKVAVSAPSDANPLQWGYGEKTLAGAIVSERQVDFDIVQMRFANNVDANIKYADYKPGEILAQIRIQIPSDQYPAGFSELASRAFISGGLGKHSAQDLRAIMAGKSVRIQGPTFEEDAIIFSASCLPSEQELCCQQLRAYLLDPGWRQEAETTAKAAWLEELKSLETNLDAQISRRFKSLVVNNVPHRRQATEDEARSVTFASLRAWMTQHLVESPLTISMIGDLDAGFTKELMVNWFSNLPDRKANIYTPDMRAPGVLIPTEPMPKGSHLYAVPGSVPRAVIRIGWPTDDFYDIPKMRRLGLLAEVLSYQLRESLREKFGQAYSPYATRYASEVYRGFGYITAQAAVASDKVDDARHLMLEVAQELADKGVSAFVLAQVKAPIIKNLTALRQQNQYWLMLVMSRCQNQPQRLEWATTIATDYAAINAAELSTLAKQYLGRANTLQVIGVCAGADGEVK